MVDLHAEILAHVGRVILPSVEQALATTYDLGQLRGFRTLSPLKGCPCCGARALANVLGELRCLDCGRASG